MTKNWMLPTAELPMGALPKDALEIGKVYFAAWAQGGLHRYGTLRCIQIDPPLFEHTTMGDGDPGPITMLALFDGDRDLLWRDWAPGELSEAWGR